MMLLLHLAAACATAGLLLLQAMPLVRLAAYCVMAILC